MKLIDDIDLDIFAGGFLESYLKEGFASLPKREIDLLILKLLLKNKAAWKVARPTAFELAKQLKVKRGRVLSMLDELSYRQADENEALAKLVDILTSIDPVSAAGHQVKFQVEDGFVRECAKEIIRDDYGVVDTSFDSTIVTLSSDKFFFLASKLVDTKKQERLKKDLEKYAGSIGPSSEESIAKVFARNFVAGAGKEAGTRAVRLGFTLLTGGLSDVSDAVAAVFAP